MGIFAVIKAASWAQRLIGLGLIVALVLGLFFSGKAIGYNSGINDSKIAIANYGTQLAKTETRIIEKTGPIQIKYVIKYKDREAAVTTAHAVLVDTAKNFVPQQFTFSKGWINAFNGSILDTPISKEDASNVDSSGVTDKDGLTVLLDNNAKCKIDQSRLDNLIDVYIETRAAYDQVNKEKQK